MIRVEKLRRKKLRRKLPSNVPPFMARHRPNGCSAKIGSMTGSKNSRDSTQRLPRAQSTRNPESPKAVPSVRRMSRSED